MNLTNPSTIKHLLAENNLSPNRSLGQHFVTSRKFIDRLVALADIQKNDIMVEVGPGLGAITESLLKRGRQVIAVEADQGLARFLKQHFRNERRLTVLQKDILGVSENELPDDYKLVSNLPYQITSPFLEKFLWGLNKKPYSLTLGVQKEVAERVTATPPAMNRLAVLAQCLAKTQKHATFPPSIFYPQPQVSTNIIALVPKNIPAPLRPLAETLLETTQAGFNQKRKKLIKSLEKVQEKARLQACWQELGLSPDTRPQELHLNQWVTLTQCLHQKNDRN